MIADLISDMLLIVILGAIADRILIEARDEVLEMFRSEWESD